MRTGCSSSQSGPTTSTGPPTTPGATSAPCPSGATIPKGSPMTPQRGTCSSATASGSRSTTSIRSTAAFGDGNDTVTQFDVAQYGAGDCEGLGIDPARNSLLCVDPSTPDNIYEVGKDGALLRILSMAALPTSHAVVADVTMAPSSNPTDSPATMNYWIVDRHLDNGNHPEENDGLLYEMHLESVPPDTTITSGPPAATNDPTPTFSFSSSEAGSTFECKLDSGPMEHAAHREPPRTSPTAPTPSTCVPWMRSGTSTPRRPPARSRSAPPRSRSWARSWWSLRRRGPWTTSRSAGPRPRPCG